jgi:hypothetical protein
MTLGIVIKAVIVVLIIIVLLSFVARMFRGGNRR